MNSARKKLNTHIFEASDSHVGKIFFEYVFAVSWGLHEFKVSLISSCLTFREILSFHRIIFKTSSDSSFRRSVSFRVFMAKVSGASYLFRSLCGFVSKTVIPFQMFPLSSRLISVLKKLTRSNLGRIQCFIFGYGNALTGFLRSVEVRRPGEDNYHNDEREKGLNIFHTGIVTQYFNEI